MSSIQQLELLERLRLLGKTLRLQMVRAPAQRDTSYLGFLKNEIELHLFALSQLDKDFNRSQISEQLALFADPSAMLVVDASKHEEIQINIGGGLGDVLCITAVIRELKARTGSGPIVNLSVPNQASLELLANNPKIDQLWINGTKQAPPKKHSYSISVGSLGTDVYHRAPAAQILAGALGFQLSDIRPEIYLSKTEIEQAKQTTETSTSEKLVVIAPVSRQPANQNWPIKYWAELIEQFPTYQFAQVGLPDEPRIDNTLDWRMESGIRESLALLSQSSAMIGMDTFWGHAAAALEVNSVVLFGGTHPSVFSYPTTSVIYKDLHCSPCHHTLRSRSCPYATECINTIAVSEVKAKLKAIL